MYGPSAKKKNGPCREVTVKEEGWFLGVADTNDVIQKIEKTLNNTHTTTQKLTNNSFRNTKKHPEEVAVSSEVRLNIT